MEEVRGIDEGVLGEFAAEVKEAAGRVEKKGLGLEIIGLEEGFYNRLEGGEEDDSESGSGSGSGSETDSGSGVSSSEEEEEEEDAIDEVNIGGLNLNLAPPPPPPTQQQVPTTTTTTTTTISRGLLIEEIN